MRKALIAVIAGLSLGLMNCSNTSYSEKEFSPHTPTYQINYKKDGLDVMETRRLVTDGRGVMTGETIGVKRTLIKDVE